VSGYVAGADAAAIAILVAVSVQRVVELVYGRANEARLRARGAIEFGRSHYPAIVALHAAWLIGLWCLAWDRSPSFLWLVGFVALQILRVWVLFTLGERWTTRILVLPGAPLVNAGPYRYFSHPNYAVVVGELFVLPAVFGLLWYAIAFSILNAIVLAMRIGVEENALRRNAQPANRATSDGG
jgi:methyltransferase